jgi:hypothetical protein
MSILKYPKDISAEYYIKFQFYKYEPPYSQASATTARVNQNDTTRGYNTSVENNLQRSGAPEIYLPMPADIGSQYSGQWGGQGVNTAASSILSTIGQAAGMTTGGGMKNAATIIKNALNLPAGNPDDAIGTGLEAAFQSAKEFLNKTPLIGANLTTNQLLSLGTNAILNPNTELLYNGTDLRTHGYKFKLVPNSSSEATDIKKIVEIFKKAALPKRQASVFGADARNFIGIPDVCKVEFIKRGGGNNVNLPKYKLSAISNVDVNYITDGQYIEYEDGFPLGIELTLAFKELKLLFSEEIGEADSNYR